MNLADRLGQEQVNVAAVAKLWAERKAGELLAATPRNQGGRPAETASRTEGVSEASTLADLGVTEKESHRWQKLAAIPEPGFETHNEMRRLVRRHRTLGCVHSRACVITARILTELYAAVGPRAEAVILASGGRWRREEAVMAIDHDASANAIADLVEVRELLIAARERRAGVSRALSHRPSLMVIPGGAQARCPGRASLTVVEVPRGQR